MTGPHFTRLTTAFALIAHLQDLGKVLLGAFRIRRQPSRALQMMNRPVKLVHFCVDAGKVHMCVGQIGLQLEGSSVGAFRIYQPSHHQSHSPDADPGWNVRGIDRRRAFVAVESDFDSPQTFQKGTEINKCADVIGIVPDRLLIGNLRLVVSPDRYVGDPRVVVDSGIRRIVSNRCTEMLKCAVGATCSSMKRSDVVQRIDIRRIQHQCPSIYTDRLFDSPCHPVCLRLLEVNPDLPFLTGNKENKS